MKIFAHSCCALALFSATASAATIVQTENYSFTPNGSADLVFNQFDTSLGTLESITISISLTKTGGSLFIDNDSTTPGSGDITQTVVIDLVSSDVTLTNTSFQPMGQNITAASVYSASVEGDDGDTDTIVGNSDGFQDDAGPDNDGTVFSTPVNASDSDDVASAVWGDYQGLGTYTLTVQGLQSSDTSTIGGAAFSGTPSEASGSVTVVYTYSPVPEPSITLLGGLGLLGLFRRRR